MKISYQWINEYCGLDLSVHTMVERLTLLGLEVGQVKPRVEMFSKVIVAQVQEAIQHPNADRLRLCTVFDGKDSHAVVCGAPNARAGIKVAFAQIGAILPGNFKIKKSKIRGEVSHGMLCSARELGLGEEHDGIIELPEDAPLGEDLRAYKNLDDTILDIELTPNRGDCFSLRGVARELCANQNVPFKDFQSPTIPVEHSDKVSVSLNASSCPVFSGCLIKGVDCSVATPPWMVDILECSGIRSISFIVDVTNYIMLTLGQPMHAYDANYLNDNIEVRHAQENDELLLLDGSKPKLTEDMLLITSKDSSQNSRALGLAGIMGGSECGVSDKTIDVYFEAAHFTPQYSTGKARGMGMQTEASMRFERGVDPSMTSVAIHYACEIVKKIAGGSLGEVVTTYHSCYDDYVEKNTPTINLSISQVNKILGVDIDLAFVRETLEKIGIQCQSQNDDNLQVQSPIHRFDLAIAEDYCEEIARHYGYEKILQTAKTNPQSSPLSWCGEQSYDKKRLCKQHLSSLGLSEAISYCFVNSEKQQSLFLDQPVCRLLNPISSDMDVMRLSLLPGLLQTVAYNHNHQQSDLAFFELGLCFVPNNNEVADLENIKQSEKLAFIVSNHWRSRHWRGTKEIDFYIIKGIFESILKLFSIKDVEYTTEQLPVFMHAGQSAKLLYKGQEVGVLGMLHPTILEAFDIRNQVGFCEIDWDFIQAVQTRTKFQSYAMYPKVYRDLAMLIHEEISVKQLTLAINSWKIDYLSNVHIFDLYQGEGIEEGMKSIAMCLQFESTKETLSEEQITQSFQEIQQQLGDYFGAIIRNK